MLIRHCNISKPGLFDNRVLEFDEKITVVLGRNNSGKTLLSRVIIDVLHAANRVGVLLDDKAWENLYLELLLNADGSEYRIIKNNGKTLAIYSGNRNPEDTIVSIDLRVGNPENGSSIMAHLQSDVRARWLHRFYSRIDGNVLSGLSYMPSAFDYDGSPAVMISCLRSFFVEDAPEFCSIHHRIKSILNEGNERDGFGSNAENELLALESEMKALNRRIEIIELEYSKYEKMIRERRNIEQSILQKKQEIETTAERKKIGERILENQHRITDLDVSLKSRCHELDEERAARAEIERLEKKSAELFPQFQNFSELQKANLKKIQDYYRELRDANEELNEKVSIIEKRNNIFKSAVISLAIASLLAIMLVLSGVLLIVSPVKKSLFVTSLLGFALLGVALLLFFNVVAGRSRKLADLRLKIEDLGGRIEVLLRENNVKISGLGMEPLYEFLLQYFEEYSEYTELQMDILKLKNTLRGDRDLEELEREIDLLSKRKDELMGEIEKDRKLLGSDAPADPSATASLEFVFSLEKKLESIEQEITYDSGLLARIDEEIRAMSFQDDEKKECLEKKKKLARKIEEQTARKEAMKFLLGIFDATEESRWRRIRDGIARRSEEIFHEMTEKSYITQIESELFGRLVDGVPIEGLHRSVIHLLHLSVKLAMTDFLIDFSQPLPLILDDPFLFMDEVRMSRLKEILDRVSSGRQVIVFTHGIPFDGWGKMVEI